MEIDMMEHEFIATCTRILETSTTARRAATALHKVCRDYAKKAGMNPDIEVTMRHEGKGHYWVCWESGPYEWGIIATMNSTGPVLAEPRWGFDLNLYDDA